MLKLSLKKLKNNDSLLYSRRLKTAENAAIPRRKEILELEVNRQRIREANLQKAFSDAQFEYNRLTNQVNEQQVDPI